MNLYKLLCRPLLFLLSPESSHHLAITALKFAGLPLISTFVSSAYRRKSDALQVKTMGLNFSNPVGLAAGFDKNAVAAAGAESIGFGYVEIGTVTPLPQPGNSGKRLFRLKPSMALQNRLGFPNVGMKAVKQNIRRFRRNGYLIGISIGKGVSTPLDKSTDDYIACLDELYVDADYFAVNVSSPNTSGLRDLQHKAYLLSLCKTLIARSQELAQSHSIAARPLLIKISPDLSNSEMDDVLEVAISTGIAGIIATNTTTSNVETFGAVPGMGGVSGRPLSKRSTDLVRYISQKMSKRLTIIAAGGIFTPDDALEKLEAGADLLQIYTGLVYEGPSLASKINRELLKSGRFATSSKLAAKSG
ncbi:MAG: quinone-dependent dihydroorotate dehydrogenase [Dehalococcoidia bacterium]|nr:quinone-dependent dihydroorotate dehydrogenase [Dehalococcoidia bacterium]